MYINQTTPSNYQCSILNSKKMTFLHQRFVLSCLLMFTCSQVLPVSSRGPIYKPPSVERLTDRFHSTPVDGKMTTFFGASHIHMKSNGSYADIVLDKTSGSGLVSKYRYHHGFFSVAIKLPTGDTSGVVLAFYMSNADVFPHNHDEIDFELLGHVKRRQWVLQTNIYGNGSVKTGREEKFYLWFDPTQEFHQYSMLWNTHHIVFLADNIPIREVIHNQASSSLYPSKPMSLYTTIWDGSKWATHGGKYPVNYRYAPFVASLGELKAEGCLTPKTNSTSIDSCSKSPTFLSSDPVEGDEYIKLTSQQTVGLKWARSKHMFYSYCKDTSRYKVLPAECKA
ncbi:putative xyloglucan endotransglucosylase/hydrolase protein 33 [Bidens hawaiensis]|uniref:putative xyloglucan endotransglucosylase/hydrolase protein 33 n=1 Tax=Bidens hawaiensis TaxID=980011 RepID=UPI00404A0848